MPTFSIIIPTYNSSKTVGNCINSILTQTYTDYEILIMDGLSTDNTLDILNSYQDIRIHVISEKDNGVYDAMNKGIEKSRGEWLYFLGSDDYLYDNAVLSDISDYIKEKDSDIVYGDAYMVGQQCRQAGIFTRKRFNVANICHQSIFYSKNIFSRLGMYNLEFPLYADWDFNIRCFATPYLKINYIDRVIVYYNDMSGISNSGLDDPSFIEIYGIRNWQKIEKLNIQILALENSREFKLGKIILSPIRKIRNLFNE
ncbi:glycosyltransferase [Dysgonomonas sp. 521]|uniref:glycosyltransferase family 2 protein n=1 Tax=Dysgonomonas sp. 521 TaxID=2302932 RepID=UPI0013D278D0|nr:glycosyltransferase family 2 protein [Dysgonomonas sp. 521]NDV95254.1 glycosyltransferase [Dysgonomonas sp. 521]